MLSSSYLSAMHKISQVEVMEANLGGYFGERVMGIFSGLQIKQGEGHSR